MTPERFRQIEELYHAVAAASAEERVVLMARVDPELRRQVESLLVERSGADFLEHAAIQGASQLRNNSAGASLVPGACLGPYRIDRKLGEGGMGEVYRAVDTRLDRAVAIKVTREQFSSRFEREARAISALNQPNICTLYDVGPNYLVMELIEGESLAARLRNGPLSFELTMKYGAEIADALAAAHGRGIVHRDLKPANVMITAKGSVKVLDFGLAKLSSSPESDGETGATATMGSDTGAIVGTVAYMSPEQAQGFPIDARSDIFAFGIVLYEMLTGKQPFTGNTKLSTLSAIVNQEPVPAKLIAKDLPSELDRIVGRCLRKDPARRFQNMADLHVALEELQEESAVERSVGLNSSKRPNKRVRRLAVAAALVAAIVVGVWQIKKLASPMPQPRVTQVTTYTGSQWGPSLSPDGGQVAFCWDGGNGRQDNIYVKILGEPNALQITHDPEGDEYPAWSPDGKRIAFRRLGVNSGIYTTSPLGGAEQKLTNFPTLGAISWTPDGKSLAVSSRGSGAAGVFLLPADGGEPRRIASSKPSTIDLAPIVSRDGHALAYANCSGLPCDIYVQDLGSRYVPSGSPRRITLQPIALTDKLAWAPDGESIIADGTAGSNNLTYLWRLAVHSNAPPQRVEIAGARVGDPYIGAGGNRLVYRVRRADFDIWRYHLGGTAEPFIVSSLTDYNAEFSPDGSKIAFESDRTGDASEIWDSQADGSGIVQLTNLLGRHQGTPHWSPDGRWILFDSAAQDGNMDIFVVDATGGKPRPITSWPTNEAVGSWSRDGKWIYFHSNHGGRREIWRVPFAGGQPEQITKNGGDAAFESADGKTLFYVKSTESPLFAQSLSGGEEKKLLDRVWGRAFVPVDDGIYYIGSRDEDHKWQLQFFQFSNNTSRLLTKIEGVPFLGLGVSHDRRTILFSQSLKDGMNLMMIDNFR